MRDNCCFKSFYMSKVWNLELMFPSITIGSNLFLQSFSQNGLMSLKENYIKMRSNWNPKQTYTKSLAKKKAEFMSVWGMKEE